MGNVHMEAAQINYRGGEKKMSVEEALKNTSGEAAAIAQLQQDVTGLNTAKANKADIATEFTDLTNYNAGDLVYYEGDLYEFQVDHTAGAWETSEVIQKDLSDIVTTLESGLTSLTTLVAPTMLSAATLDEGGYIVVGNMVIFDITFTLAQNVTDTVALFRVPSAGSRNVGLRLTNANDGSEVSSSCRIFGNNVYAGITGNTGERYNVAGVYMKV